MRKKRPPANIVIRPVDADNLVESIEAAVSIFGEVDREAIEHEFRASVGIYPERESVTTDYNIGDIKFFVAYEKNKLVGVAGYYNVKGHEEDVWLDWMGVAPLYRNRNIGTVLVKESFNRAVQDLGNVQNFRIWTTLQSEYAAARNLYRKLGFSEENYKEGADDAANMVMVYTKAADPAKTSASWKDSFYPLDCEYHTIPDLNQRMGFDTGEKSQRRPPKNDFKPIGSASPLPR